MPLLNFRSLNAVSTPGAALWAHHRTMLGAGTDKSSVAPLGGPAGRCPTFPDGPAVTSQQGSNVSHHDRGH